MITNTSREIPEENSKNIIEEGATTASQKRFNSLLCIDD